MTTQNNDYSISLGIFPPKWFWWVAGIGLTWNLLGVVAFVSQMTMDLQLLSDAERTFHEAMPIWAVAGFAVAVAGGVLGCLALLLRKPWALAMLLICLLGIIIQSGHSIFVGNGIEVFGPAGLILPAMTLVIAAALAAFARHSSQRGWLL